jgi:hypothetical protein
MKNMAGSPVKGKLETVTVSGTGKFVAHMISKTYSLQNSNQGLTAERKCSTHCHKVRH